MISVLKGVTQMARVTLVRRGFKDTQMARVTLVRRGVRVLFGDVDEALSVVGRNNYNESCFCQGLKFHVLRRPLLLLLSFIQAEFLWE